MPPHLCIFTSYYLSSHSLQISRNLPLYLCTQRNPLHYITLSNWHWCFQMVVLGFLWRIYTYTKYTILSMAILTNEHVKIGLYNYLQIITEVNEVLCTNSLPLSHIWHSLSHTQNELHGHCIHPLIKWRVGEDDFSELKKKNYGLLIGTNSEEIWWGLLETW